MANGLLSLSIGKTALQAQQTALDVTAQNLSNANTEGYARKVIRLQNRGVVNLPDVTGPVGFAQVGTGVEVSKIESIRDLRLNQRIRDVVSEFKQSELKRDVLDEVEALFTGEVDMNSTLDDFFSALHDLSAAPESLTARSVVRARGVELTDLVRATADQIETIEADLSDRISDLAAKINTISKEFASLNEKVSALQSADMSAGDFEDRRQVLLEQLAEIGDVQTVQEPAGSLTVLLAGQVIVQGFQSFDVSVEKNPSGTGLPRLTVGSNENDVLEARSGILQGLTELRDTTLAGIKSDLNEFVITLTEEFNKIHKTGFGLDGSTGVDFFTTGSIPSTETRLFSVEGTTFVEDPTSALDGDPSTTAPENFESSPVGVGGFVINGIGITYDGSTDSLQDIVDRINAASAGVVASITPENKLKIVGTRQSDYTISTMADNGNLLERLGILPSGSAYPPSVGIVPATAVFSGKTALHPNDSAALNFKVTDEIQGDLNKIAAAKGDDLTQPPDGVGDQSRGPGDGANALELAQLRDATVTTTRTGTFSDFLTGMLGELGVEAGSASRMTDGFDAQIEQLKQRREEIQGVSIDEEMINMIKYQRGYQAAARIVNVADQVLQTLLTLGR